MRGKLHRVLHHTQTLRSRTCAHERCVRCGPCMGPWLGGSCVGDREATDASHAWGAHPSGGYIISCTTGTYPGTRREACIEYRVRLAHTLVLRHSDCPLCTPLVSAHSSHHLSHLLQRHSNCPICTGVGCPIINRKMLRCAALCCKALRRSSMTTVDLSLIHI